MTSSKGVSPAKSRAVLTGRGRKNRPAHGELCPRRRVLPAAPAADRFVESRALYRKHCRRRKQFLSANFDRGRHPVFLRQEFDRLGGFGRRQRLVPWPRAAALLFVF